MGSTFKEKKYSLGRKLPHVGDLLPGLRKGGKEARLASGGGGAPTLRSPGKFSGLRRGN